MTPDCYFGDHTWHGTSAWNVASISSRSRAASSASTGHRNRNPQRTRLTRDVTALRNELASIAIMLQERKRLPDLGGANFALVFGAVLVYVLELEEARDAFVSLMDDGLTTAITEMARWDAEALQTENAALRALVSWIDGMLLDSADHTEIREGIYRAMETK